MTNLEQALINSGECLNEKDANNLVKEMYERVSNGEEDPEDILWEYGLESDYTMDILGWKPLRDEAPISEQKKDSMASKIQALMAKADNLGATQAERDSAMMKAQELIQKYGIESARIGRAKGRAEFKEEDIIEERVKYEDPWDRDMFRNVAVGNMCQIIYESSANLIYIIGKESNVNCVIPMLTFYKKSILNLAVDFAMKKSRVAKMLAKDSKGNVPVRALAKIQDEEKKNIQDYLAGAVLGLKNAMERKEVEFSSVQLECEDGTIVTGGEVMVINKDRIKEYIRQKYPYLRHFRGASAGGNSDSSSFRRGVADGGGLGSSQKRIA